MGEKDDLSECECGTVVDASQAGLSIPETAGLRIHLLGPWPFCIEFAWVYFGYACFLPES